GPDRAEGRAAAAAERGPALRHAAGGRAPVPRLRLPVRRAHRARRRADRDRAGPDPGPAAGRRAAAGRGRGTRVSQLVIAGGRIFDPGQGLDLTGDITVTDGVITGIGPAAAGPGAEVADAAGLLVTPGWVDLHTHLYEGVSHYGIDPDTYCLRRGVTNAVDAGSAGAQTFPGFRRYVIERSATRVLAFLNIAVEGMISALVGELEDIRWASPEQAIARAREHPDLIVGIKVRLGYQMVGQDPAPALRLAREAADALGLPLMVHVIDMRPPIAWLLPYLHRGDVITHCLHGNEGG